MFAHSINADLSLELLEHWHADELFAVTDANRAHLRRWMPWLDRVNRVDDTRAFIAMAQQQYAIGNGFQTAMRYKGALVGVIGQHRIDWSNRFTSIGYWLAEHAQGLGLMTMACNVHIEHLFGRLGLHRIEIRCAVGNLRSRAIPERLGFREEGIIRDGEWLYDHFVDHVVYGLLDTDRDNAAPERQSARGDG